MNTLIYCVIFINTYVYSSKTDQVMGPFKLRIMDTVLDIIAKKNISLEKITVERNVELTTVYRSFWRSYCYNGGSLDPNTGCPGEIVQLIPNYEEAKVWETREMCQVGADCTDCWGTESEGCLNPETKERKWVPGKE